MTGNNLHLGMSAIIFDSKACLFCGQEHRPSLMIPPFGISLIDNVYDQVIIYPTGCTQTVMLNPETRKFAVITVSPQVSKDTYLEGRMQNDN